MTLDFLYFICTILRLCQFWKVLVYLGMGKATQIQRIPLATKIKVIILLFQLFEEHLFFCPKLPKKQTLHLHCLSIVLLVFTVISRKTTLLSSTFLWWILVFPKGNFILRNDTIMQTFFRQRKKYTGTLISYKSFPQASAVFLRLKLSLLLWIG